ncbi:MAG: hypothetical protein HY586_08215 [Candidatus Omnitrophica bacterium]|nr:hypothetical protein [Candidatus Omnitrophota bacterium]
MLKKVFCFAVLAAWFASVGSVSLWAQETERKQELHGRENIIWKIKPSESHYMKYFGKRVIDVNRKDADRFVPQEFGWQGNQMIFIFHLTSDQLERPTFTFVIEIFSRDYDVDEPVEIDIYAGTNINSLKTVTQGLKIEKVGEFPIEIPSSLFYVGGQNFIKLVGRNVHPIGYGENPPNCRFASFRLSVPSAEAEEKPAENQREEKYEEEKEFLAAEQAATQDEMLPI